jgi:hypothetical protein
LLLLAACAALSAPGPLLAATSTWIGANGGSWSTPGNWNPSGVPVAGDNVLFAPASGSYINNGNYSTASPLGTLTFGVAGGASGPTLTQSTNTLATGTEIFDTGTYTQNGGTNSFAYNTYVSNTSGDIATYNLTGGTFAGGLNFIINTGGSLIQTGGLLSALEFAPVGGSVSISAGTLSAEECFINGGSDFVQTGGDVAMPIDVEYASYQLSGGSINSGSLGMTVGNGVGSFTQTAGVCNADQLAIAQSGFGGTSGTYTLSGGTLNSTNIIVGWTDSTSGNLIQNGTSYINLGSGFMIVGTGGIGTASFSAGTLNALGGSIYIDDGTLLQSGTSNISLSSGTLIVGNGTGSTGVASFSGGSLNVSGGVVYVGYESGIGTFLQSGTLSVSNLGTLALGDGTGSTGTVLLSGGSLTASNAYVGYEGGAGTFAQSGGSSSLGNLQIGVGTSSTGVTSLTAGTLTASTTVVGEGGSGTFIQSGGVSSLGGLTVGYSGAGTLLLQSGSLTATVTAVGFGGGATFSQSGGSSSLGEFFVGDMGPGYASLSGGTLIASFAVVGDSGNGTFVQNGSTSFANVGSLYIGAGASGTLNLSAGTLNAISTVVGEATAGTFTQSGGTSSLGALAVGSLGYLSITSSTASASVGTIAAGGTLTVANGTLTVPGGTLTNSGFIEASGTFSNILTSTFSNSGTVSANASVASFGGSLTNNPGSTFGVYGLAIFDGPVVGAGAFTGSGTLDFISVLNSTQPLVFAGTAAVGLSSTANVPTVQVRNLQVVGGTLNFAGSGTAGTGSISSLLISSGGHLNLNTNGLVIEYGAGPSPVGDLSFAHTARSYPSNSIQAYAQSAIDNLNWDGPGITSNFAETDPNGLTAVGIVDENDLGIYPNDYTVAGGGNGTWMGQPINDTNNVLVRMTYYGDGNDDGVVNRFDVTALSQGYSGLAGYVGWSDGDYNYDGQINKNDVSLLAQSYVFQGAPLGDAITPAQARYLLALDPDMPANVQGEFDAIAAGETPEPTTLGLLGAAGVGLMSKRRRRH